MASLDLRRNICSNESAYFKSSELRTLQLQKCVGFDLQLPPPPPRVNLNPRVSYTPLLTVHAYKIQRYYDVASYENELAMVSRYSYL